MSSSPFDRARPARLDCTREIDPAIFPELWEDTWGQPWLVNVLGYEVTWRDRELRDRSRPITLERYKAARERLIQSRATHLDQLTARGHQGPLQKIVVELKLLRTAPETTLADGLKQTAECADKCGADEAYLLIFDRRPDRSWDERIWQRAESHAGRTINVWGM